MTTRLKSKRFVWRDCRYETKTHIGNKNFKNPTDKKVSPNEYITVNVNENKN